MIPNIDSIVKELRSLIREEIFKLQRIQAFVVTGVNALTYSVQIKSSIKAVQFDNVPILGLGLGNLKGIMKLPSVGDWVLIAFIGNDALRPVVIGTLFDQFTQGPDNIPQTQEDQLVIIGKEAGSFITLNPDNTVIVRSVDASGNVGNGARFKLNPDGSFKLFNRGNYGIECDAFGAITIHGITINNTQTAGTW